MVELHARLNAMSEAEAREALGRCCGARRWVEAMLARRPFASDGDVHDAAAQIWAGLEREDHLEAFAAHPALGASPEELARRFGHTANWSAKEQAGTHGADDATRAALRAGNVAYRQRFGFTFILCATGKSAPEMLRALQARLDNEADVELAIAAEQQAAITRLRLEKLAT